MALLQLILSRNILPDRFCSEPSTDFNLLNPCNSTTGRREVMQSGHVMGSKYQQVGQRVSSLCTLLYQAILPLLLSNQLFQHHQLNNPVTTSRNWSVPDSQSFIHLHGFLYRLYTVLVTRFLLYSVIITTPSPSQCFSTKFPSQSPFFFLSKYEA